MKRSDFLKGMTPAAVAAPVAATNKILEPLDTQRDAALAEILAMASEGFNVKAYGAKGDGSTDDTAAIQAAISAAGSLGAIIYFPKGTYGVSADINVPGGVMFVGAALLTVGGP